MIDHWSAWSVEPLVLLAAASALVLYARRWWRVCRPGGIAPGGLLRGLSFTLGIDLLVVALVSPLDHLGHDYLLSAHMAQHLAIGDLAPLLLVAGMSGPMAPRAIPPGLDRPWVAFAAWSAVTAGWYVPAAYDLALGSTRVHWAMQASIIVTGIAVWAHILGVVERTRMSHARRAGYALGLLAVGMVVSEVLFLNDPLYTVYAEQTERVFGWSPAADQVKASLLMTAEQMITLVVAAVLLMWAHVERAEAERDEPALPERPLV